MQEQKKSIDFSKASKKELCELISCILSLKSDLRSEGVILKTKFKKDTNLKRAEFKKG